MRGLNGGANKKKKAEHAGGGEEEEEEEEANLPACPPAFLLPRFNDALLITWTRTAAAAPTRSCAAPSPLVLAVVNLRACWMQATNKCLFHGNTTFCNCPTDLCNGAESTAAAAGHRLRRIASLLCATLLLFLCWHRGGGVGT